MKKHIHTVLKTGCFALFLAPWTLSHSAIDIVIDVSTSNNTPEAAVFAGFDLMCPKIADLNSDPGSGLEQLQSICTARGSATNEELKQAYRAMSARSNTTLTSASTNGPGAAPLELIGKRLAALRRAAENAQSAYLQLDNNGKPLSQILIAEIFDNLTGGGASADQQSRLSGFLTAMSMRSDQLETQTLAGYHGESNSGVLGLDYRFSDKTVTGIAGRYAESEVGLNGNVGSLDAEDVNLTLYSTYYPSQEWYLEGTAHYGQGQFDLTREIEFSLGGTPVDETASSETDGSQFGISLGGGYEWYVKNGAVAQLTGNLHYKQTTIAAYEETGANGLNLAIDEQTIDSLQTRLGAQLSKAASYSWGVVLPQVNLTWVYEFMQDGEKVQASFVSDPTDTNFAFTTDEKDPSYFIVSLGVVTVLPGGFTAFLQGERYLQIDNYEQKVWSMGARWEF